MGKKETMTLTMQSCKLHKQISDQYLVNRLTCTLLMVFLNNKLLKLTIDGDKLFQISATTDCEQFPTTATTVRLVCACACVCVHYHTLFLSISASVCDMHCLYC